MWWRSPSGGWRGGLQRRQKRHCGAAATAALVWGDTLTVANVGDCRGLLLLSSGGDDENGEDGEEGGPDGGGDEPPPGSQRQRRRRRRAPWRPLRLTQDHSADDPAERARVEAEGGTLIPPPPKNNGNGNSEKGWRLGPVGLAVTRALGDADVAGCSAVPHISSLSSPRRLDPTCLALVLVTDGVTEAMEARRGDATSFELEARRNRRRERQRERQRERESNGGGGGNGVEDDCEEEEKTPSELVDEEIAALVADTVKEASMAARRLVVEAVEHRQGRDNAAALVVYLSPVESLERVF